MLQSGAILRHGDRGVHLVLTGGHGPAWTDRHPGMCTGSIYKAVFGEATARAETSQDLIVLYPSDLASLAPGRVLKNTALRRKVFKAILLRSRWVHLLKPTFPRQEIV